MCLWCVCVYACFIEASAITTRKYTRENESFILLNGSSSGDSKRMVSISLCTVVACTLLDPQKSNREMYFSWKLIKNDNEMY